MRHYCTVCLEDTAQHTLEECPVWAALRRDLIVAIGGSDLSLAAVVKSMVESESAWDGLASFC